MISVAQSDPKQASGMQSATLGIGSPFTSSGIGDLASLGFKAGMV